jgi:hypothetical protein
MMVTRLPKRVVIQMHGDDVVHHVAFALPHLCHIHGEAAPPGPELRAVMQ